MSIKGNNSTGLISVAATDTVILQNNNTTGRFAITQIHLHEYGGTGDTIELFRSADAVSTAAERVDSITLAANETEVSIAATVVLSPGEYLLGNATTGALVNAQAIYTTYTGSS